MASDQKSGDNAASQGYPSGEPLGDRAEGHDLGQFGYKPELQVGLKVR